MHPFLSRLGIRAALQEFLQPFCFETARGDLAFSYGETVEFFGMARHYVPAATDWWQAGYAPPAATSHLVIASSAMESIAFLQLQGRLAGLEGLRLIAAGTCPEPSAFFPLAEPVKRRRITILYGGDLPGRIASLRIAAALRGFPLSAKLQNDKVIVSFRAEQYAFDTDLLTLPAFERQCGSRFYIHTPQPRSAANFLDQLRYG